MDNYIVSARKYRPSTFRSVVGQKSLTTTLKNAIQSNKLAHAYLFCGPRGVGKTSCARIFAKTINCLNPTADGEACNECESCKAFNEQRSYNIHELDAASNNSVDDIRALIDQVRIPPQIGKYRRGAYVEFGSFQCVSENIGGTAPSCLVHSGYDGKAQGLADHPVPLPDIRLFAYLDCRYGGTSGICLFLRRGDG